jgi:hypothetical protein
MSKFDPDEFNRWSAEFIRAADRLRDEREPDWPEAWIGLIDALRRYIKVDVAIAKELLSEGCITRAQYDAGIAALERDEIALLKRHEAHCINPSLHGLIKTKSKL